MFVTMSTLTLHRSLNFKSRQNHSVLVELENKSLKSIFNEAGFEDYGYGHHHLPGPFPY